ncbi:CRTAC1 family protein, partial [bacterium]|nr:CRTAC1 family protein [bacterium]
AESEDMGGLFFDADSDGNDDLYVVSGGVEAEIDHASYRDRLYLNQGPGRPFRKASLPDFRDSGGPIAAADIDRDGDLDLFIGGRLVPGAHPTTPNSRLLINQNGKFSDQSDQIAPGLRTTGLVTSAVWSDYDQDGWIDLLVAHEWGPVRIWKNKQGQLVDQSQTIGTENLLGWWNSISPGDLDNDGDLDYLVGNVGLNSKYEAPSYLYYGDFDDSGKKRIIEAEVENSIIYPVRGRSCTSAAIPMVGDKFKTYRDFASAPLQKIFSLESLGKAQRLEANTLTTGWLRNDGGKKLTFIPLTDPSAQIAPVFGTLVGDFNNDGDLDLFLAQNSFSPQPETGNMDGGLSTLLIGNGRGEFSAIRADQSGIMIPHDAKSVARLSSHLLVGINNKAPYHLELTSHQENLEIQLQGPPGNPHGYGARITLKFEKSAQLHQITAGSGYLSQSSPFPSIPTGKKLISIQTHWPNGKVSSTTDIPPKGKIRIAFPK